MNDLSLALLLADFASNAKPALIVPGVVLLAVFGFWTLLSGMGEAERSPPRAMLATALALFFIGCAVPNYRTLVMIAASEAGEAAATSALGREILSDLRAALARIADTQD